jgi:hypothetical protein
MHAADHMLAGKWLTVALCMQNACTAGKLLEKLSNAFVRRERWPVVGPGPDVGPAADVKRMSNTAL